jgi:phytoene dehydrogenase-like protein
VSSAVVVGSGPNGLAAAIALAAAGLEVTVLEAAGELGGGTRSSELTLPGLTHDECSAAHPLAVDNAFTRAFGLHAHALRWRWPEVQYAHPLDGGHGVAAYRSVQETATALGGREGGRWRGLFGPLTDSFDRLAGELLAPVLHRSAHPLLLARFGALAALPATVLGTALGGERASALFGGVAAHGFRSLYSPLSASVALVLGTAAHCYGWPVAEGGSGAITRAMAGLLAHFGGTVQTGVTVRSLAELEQAEIVMLDTAPGAAAAICGDRLPEHIRRSYARYRHGPAAFKVDFAVHDGVPWSYEPARRAGTLHLGGSLREIALAERQILRGRMPERPFVLCCQQYLADPTRSAGDVHPVYAYAHVPAGYAGDATAAIERQVERFAPGFGERVLARRSTTPAEFQAGNANYVGGDIATGANSGLQLVLRPRASTDPYATGIPGVYLCSAATPPGAGAHGLCGYQAARAALNRRARE